MSDKKRHFEQLVAYIEGRLSPEEQSEMEKRIAQDPALQKTIAVMKGLKSEAEKIDWHKMQKPSHDLFDRLLKDIKRRKSEAGGKRGVNIFDSGLLPIPEGVRPAEVDTRRLKYLIGDGELELSLYPVSPKSFEIIGQVKGLENAGVLSVEIKSGKTRISVAANEFNLFRIPRITSGSYKLNLIEGKKVIGKIDLTL